MPRLPIHRDATGSSQIAPEGLHNMTLIRPKGSTYTRNSLRFKVDVSSCFGSTTIKDSQGDEEDR